MRNLRQVDWRNRTVPASACGTVGDVVLRDGGAFDRSGGGETGTFVVLDGPVQYGDLDSDGYEEAAVPIICEGMQTTSSVLIYRLDRGVVSLLGKVSTTQPVPPEHLWPFIDNAQTRVEPGRIAVIEMWYEPSDDDFCCPSTRAETVWGYVGTTLARQTTVTAPRSAPQARPEDFVGEWYVHGAHLKITSPHNGVETVSNAGSCTADSSVLCSKRTYLQFSTSDDRRGLIATVVGVTYLTPDDQVGDPPPDAVSEGGDTFRLEFVFPNLLKATTLHSSNPDHLNLLGNPYFCRDGLAREVSFACGA